MAFPMGLVVSDPKCEPEQGPEHVSFTLVAGQAVIDHEDRQ
jgi:hypothetical protein